MDEILTEAVQETLPIDAETTVSEDADKEAVATGVQAPSNEELLDEIARLKKELSLRDSMTERFVREGEEFRALYPDTDLQSLPDGVWEDVRRGVPLAAAYALAERKRFCTVQKANEYNMTNRMRSSGSLEPTDPDYFSPTEVRAMSQSEVRANYDKIMRSMQKWH